MSGGQPNPRGTRADGSLGDRLRHMILTGEIPPGSTVTQVELARILGVSTTPLREAMRRLQSEGLLEIERNRRARVAPLDLDELHAVYAGRVLLESLGVTVTAGSADADLDRALDDDLDVMARAAEANDLDAWNVAHGNLHRRLVSGAPPKLLPTIASFQDRAERFRSLAFAGNLPRAWATQGNEHTAIVQAVHDRDAAGAASALADHLARTAIMLSATFAPEIDPSAVRAAVGLVAGSRTLVP